MGHGGEFWQNVDHYRREWQTISAFVPWEPHAAAAAAASLQSCLTLYDPIDGSSPGSPVPGILQARVLEWGAIAFSNAWKWKVTVKSLSHVWLLATPWTAAYPSPQSTGFSRQEYWSGVPLPSPMVKLHNHKTKNTEATREEDSLFAKEPWTQTWILSPSIQRTWQMKITSTFWMKVHINLEGYILANYYWNLSWEF